MGFAISGVYSAAATPLTEDLQPDAAKLAAHCRRLIADGCDGIALLGTTGEANSFSVAARQKLLEGVLAGGLQPNQLAPGVGVAAVDETIELTRHALSVGITNVVVLPPFYYKTVSDDGLFAAFARIVEGVGDDRLRVILYNFPQMSAMPLSLDLVARLIAAFPKVIAGVKDSSGKFDNSLGYVGLDPDFAVMIGSDPLLRPHLQAGGAGCITALSNLRAADLRTIYDGWDDPGRSAEVAEAETRLDTWRTMSMTFGSQLPAVKALLAARDRDDSWNRLAPPLLPLSVEQRDTLISKLRDMGETI